MVYFNIPDIGTIALCFSVITEVQRFQIHSRSSILVQRFKRYARFKIILLYAYFMQKVYIFCIFGDNNSTFSIIYYAKYIFYIRVLLRCSIIPFSRFIMIDSVLFSKCLFKIRMFGCIFDVSKNEWTRTVFNIVFTMWYFVCDDAYYMTNVPF
jgi:hypothetical protein